MTNLLIGESAYTSISFVGLRWNLTLYKFPCIGDLMGESPHNYCIFQWVLYNTTNKTIPVKPITFIL